jgi:hypothetical protein
LVQRRGRRARLAERFAARVDLALPAELAPVVGRRLARRRRASLVAGAVGVAPWLAFAAWRLADGDAEDGAASSR